jgi:hypothetical protein
MVLKQQGSLKTEIYLTDTSGHLEDRNTNLIRES